MQADLFEAQEPTPCCGWCVHRNCSTPMRGVGACPEGMAAADDPPCPRYFGLTQLIAATKRKP